MKHRLIINKSKGTIEWLAPPPFTVPVTNTKTERFSEIVPLDPVKRFFFRLLRRLFGEQGRVAEWTRTWHGSGWEAVVLVGVHKGETFVHWSRLACVQWEQEKWWNHGNTTTENT